MAAGWPLTQAAVAAAAAWKQVTERRRAAIPQNGPVALAAAAAAVEEEGPAAFFLPRCSPSSRQSFCEGHSCSRAGLDYHGIFFLLAFRVLGIEMAPVLGKSNQEEEVRPQDNMAVGASVRCTCVGTRRCLLVTRQGSDTRSGCYVSTLFPYARQPKPNTGH